MINCYDIGGTCPYVVCCHIHEVSRTARFVVNSVKMSSSKLSLSTAPVTFSYLYRNEVWCGYKCHNMWTTNISVLSCCINKYC